MNFRRLLAPIAALTLGLINTPLTATASTSNAWARPGTDNVAVYFTLTNTSKKPRTLVGAASPIADSVDIHETVQMGSGSSAITTMQAVSSLVIEPHQHVEFAPGGFHLMLVHMHHKLTLGKHFIVTLKFRDKTREIVSVTVANR